MEDLNLSSLRTEVYEHAVWSLMKLETLEIGSLES